MNARLLLLFALMMLSGVWTAVAVTPSPITIKATKRTASSRQDFDRVSRKVSVENTTKDIFYRFELSTRTPQVPTNVVVEWVVAVEDAKGRVHAATTGEKSASLQLGRPAVVETEDFKLEEREIRHGGKVGERGDDILGYAIRVYDEEDQIVAELIEPSRAEKELLSLMDPPDAPSHKDRKADRKRARLN